MKPSGNGRRKVLVVAEAPGETEDEEGTQLIGRSGEILRKALWELGVDLDDDCWKTNAIICRPPKNEISDEKIIDYCRPHLLQTLDELQPETVLILGQTALKSILAGIWRGELGTFGTWVGWQIPSQVHNAWLCPTYHPSYIARMSQDAVLKLWFQRHLKAAFTLQGRPWEVIPDYRQEVLKAGAERAVHALHWMREQGGVIAFDFETNRLKPDHPEAEIISCAVCWQGKRTVAYPWTPVTAQATALLLQSEVRKIGANLKFEDRWCRVVLGYPIRGWFWDTMQAAHLLDNRPGITSVKFQALVQLGLPVYDNHIRPFLEASSGNARNRIHELELEDLLLYNGLDALVEYKIAEKQLARMGIGL